MRISFKTTFLTFLGLIFCGLSYSQSEAKIYMLQLLEEEGVEYVKDRNFTNLDNAMEILDIRKENGLISETEFQAGIGKLMPLRSEFRELAEQEKIAISEKNRKEYEAKKERGETTDMFDIAKSKLKDKLDRGDITKAVYDEKLAEYNKRQAERKARKAGN